MTNNLVVQKYNPFRTPSWRYDRVLSLLETVDGQRRRASWRRDDEYIRTARRFFAEYRRLPEHLRESLVTEYPGLYYAYLIHSNDEDETRYTVQARILAKQSDAVIAEKICALPEAIHWYEALFFNVRDRLGNRDWIVKTILGPSATQGVAGRPYDATAKMFAYFAGPLVLEVVLDGFVEGDWPTSSTEISKWFDRHFETNIKRKSVTAAWNLQVNKFNVMQLFEIHARLRELEQADKMTGTTNSTFESYISEVLASASWCVGQESAKRAANVPTMIGSSELNAEESYRIANGDVELVPQLKSLTLPAPSRVREKGPSEG